MSDTRIHIKFYKAIILMSILVFSLSPCSVKRDVLDIFDIQYISGLNKVKTTSGFSIQCDVNSTTSSKVSVSKSEIKLKHKEFFYSNSIAKNTKGKAFFNEYSGYTTGNSPPKYILFKRLKVSLA
ncbi:hypothetical protein C1637_07420 [Chryseobacterium lactis]|uniref:Lipoprotein n=1 Tax=Chryseobacterium lactis TaxID=1241981 RepID=A0A3G6RPS7_CHRLC|nr:hypothetical protein [Chryseobacterium lactis]AZA84658.1 hypothetical protein EG342_23390 [Chryseobacterium lactis]AZB05047.1 hypothetical protein EG341_14270 [Chryseobacterium lactis]PNW14778.1 hypothetical protein C1637_07420 [Chryseobacterium lactis]